MEFTLSMLFEQTQEYSFDIQNKKLLSQRYKSIHLLPVESENLELDTIYITDWYDMERFEAFKNARNNKGRTCLIFLYEEDYQYAEGASVYLKTYTELAVVLNRLWNTIQEFIMLDRDMVDTVIRKLPLKDTMELFANMLKSPVVLMDSGYRMLFHRENETPDDPVYKEILENGFLPESMIKRFFSDIDGKNDNKRVNVFSIDINGRESILCNIRISSAAWATLYLAGTSRKYSNSLYDMAVVYSENIWKKLKDDWQESVNHDKEQFFMDILTNENIGESEVKSRAYALKVPYYDDYLLINLKVSQNSPSLRNIIDELRSRIGYGVYIGIEDEIVIAVNMSDEKNNAEKNKTEMTSIIEKYSVKAGVSNVVSSLGGLKTAALQARAALSINDRLCKSEIIKKFKLPVDTNKGPIYEYKDVSVYYPFKALMEKMDYRAFCEEDLLKVTSKK